MYHIYHSRAFILASRPHGEANKVLTLYTDTHGLIRAVVQAIRRENSKLRYALQDFTSASVDFVRGKEVWRVTSAIAGTQYPDTARSTPATHLRARVVTLFIRMVNGEDANSTLFQTLSDFFLELEDLAGNPDTPKERFRLLEIATVTRLLHALGHMPLPAVFVSFANRETDFQDLAVAEPVILETIAAINNAIWESGL